MSLSRCHPYSGCVPESQRSLRFYIGCFRNLCFRAANLFEQFDIKERSQRVYSHFVAVVKQHYNGTCVNTIFRFIYNQQNDYWLMILSFILCVRVSFLFRHNKRPSYDFYFIIEEPSKCYFTEKVSHSHRGHIRSVT